MARKRQVNQAEAERKPTLNTPDNPTLRRLLHWNELEEWQKDNEYIHAGYVRSENTFKAVLASLGYIHNETGNIYTHLIPSLGIASLLAILYTTSLMTPPFVMFSFGCVLCMGMSAAFHTMKSHSHRVSIIGNKFDYVGICVLIAASMIALIDYAYDDKVVQYRVFAGITLTLCLVCATVSLLERFRSREFRATRATVFICYGLSGVLPILAGYLEFGYEEVSRRAACPWLYAEAFFYIFGASLYALRFPEKWAPGNYDIVGHSHQIFHVFVVVAAWCHFNALKGAQQYAQYRKSFSLGM